MLVGLAVKKYSSVELCPTNGSQVIDQSIVKCTSSHASAELRLPQASQLEEKNTACCHIGTSNNIYPVINIFFHNYSTQVHVVWLALANQ